MRTSRLLLPVIVVLVAVPAGLAARGHGSKRGSVRVNVVRLEGVPEALGRAELAIRVSIGAKVLYTTPRVPGRDASWNKGLRAFTSAGRPLVFELLSDHAMPGDSHPASGGENPGTVTRFSAEPAPAAPRPASPRGAAGGDETLSSGMDDLVADWGTGTLDEGIDGPDKAGKKRARPENQVTVPRFSRHAAPENQVTVPRSSPVLCAAPLPWPPADGEHRLDCAGMSLVVVTKSL